MINKLITFNSIKKGISNIFNREIQISRIDNIKKKIKETSKSKWINFFILIFITFFFTFIFQTIILNHIVEYGYIKTIVEIIQDIYKQTNINSLDDFNNFSQQRKKIFCIFWIFIFIPIIASALKIFRHNSLYNLNTLSILIGISFGLISSDNFYSTSLFSFDLSAIILIYCLILSLIKFIIDINQEETPTDDGILIGHKTNHENYDETNQSILADLIAGIILNSKPKEALGIGIKGSYGSGKTRTLELIKEKVKNGLRDDINREKKEYRNSMIEIIEIFPWSYLNKESLIKELLLSISKAYQDDLFTKEMNKYLLKLSNPIFSSISTKITDIVFTHQEESIDSIHKRLTESLKYSKKEFLIIIDDIDRLNKDELWIVLKTIRTIGNFPHTTYLTCFEEPYLISAINGLNKGVNGGEFLDKIFQLSYELPANYSTSLTSHLERNLLLKCNQINQNLIFLNNQERFKNAIQQVIQIFTTYRSINNFINRVIVRAKMLNSNFDFIDLIYIELLYCVNPHKYYELFNLIGKPRYQIHSISIVQVNDKFDKANNNLISTNIIINQLSENRNAFAVNKYPYGIRYFTLCFPQHFLIFEEYISNLKKLDTLEKFNFNNDESQKDLNFILFFSENALKYYENDSNELISFIKSTTGIGFTHSILNISKSYNQNEQNRQTYLRFLNLIFSKINNSTVTGIFNTINKNIDYFTLSETELILKSISQNEQLSSNIDRKLNLIVTSTVKLWENIFLSKSTVDDDKYTELVIENLTSLNEYLKNGSFAKEEAIEIYASAKLIINNLIDQILRIFKNKSIKEGPREIIFINRELIKLIYKIEQWSKEELIEVFDTGKSEMISKIINLESNVVFSIPEHINTELLKINDIPFEIDLYRNEYKISVKSINQGTWTFLIGNKSTLENCIDCPSIKLRSEHDQRSNLFYNYLQYESKSLKNLQKINTRMFTIDEVNTLTEFKFRFKDKKILFETKNRIQEHPLDLNFNEIHYFFIQSNTQITVEISTIKNKL